MNSSKQKGALTLGNLQEQLDNYKLEYGNEVDLELIKHIEISIRNEKVRGYLEKRFYRQLTKGNKHISGIMLEFYKRVNGNPQFFNV